MYKVLGFGDQNNYSPSSSYTSLRYASIRRRIGASSTPVFLTRQLSLSSLSIFKFIFIAVGQLFLCLDNPDTKDVDESGGSIGENAVRFETYDADIDGPKNPETYLFTIENLKIINFENNEGETQFNPLQEKTYRGKQITVKALRVNPGATTTVTVRGEKSNLKKVIVVKVNEDKTFDNLSPFNENAVVTDSTYY